MKAHELKTTARHKRTRSGRGISAGRGKTAGRGTKGQNSRSGGKVAPGFEGGQNPLMRRLPKLKGFRPRPRATDTLTTTELSELKAGNITNTTLVDSGLIDSQFSSVKVILGNGELSKKYTVKLQAASASAIEAINAAGGSFEAIGVPKRQAKKANKEAK